MTTILGWIWSAGHISASPHKVTPLATAVPPKTVKMLRCWIGAFKHLKPCIVGYSTLLSPLEAATAAKASATAIYWTEDILTTFSNAQSALLTIASITIPRASDHLVITNDGAISKCGIGSVLYVIRNGQTQVGGYFSAKLKQHQLKW